MVLMMPMTYELMMPMIVTRTDALKFLTSAKQELFAGVGETRVQRALKMQNTKSEKISHIPYLSVKFLKFCFDVEHEHGNRHYQCQLSMSVGNVMIEEYTYLRSLFTYL